MYARVDVVGTNVDALAGVGDSGEGSFVEVGGNGVAVVVAFVAYPLSATVFGYGGSFGKTHAYGANAHILGGSLAGGGFGVVFKVLAVGDDYDGTSLVLHPFAVGVAIAKGFHRLVDGIADGGALRTYQRAVYLVEKEFHRTVVAGKRHLHITAACKDNKRDAVAT